ncbi:MAG: 50S ribosomal protein L4 [Rhodothalassiaceae bacterium]
MKVDVLTLDAKKAGTVDLDEAIFALEPRPDILHRVVTWQLARRRAGTHAVKFRSDVRATNKKMYRQKGTGHARHGSRRVNLFRGGGRAFGPVPRDHGFSLPKKVRKLGLKSALSAKHAAGRLIILDDLALKEGRTRLFREKLAKLGIENALFIDAPEINDNVRRAAANVPHIDLLPSVGANVYDILRRETLVLTKAALDSLAERLK